MKNPPIRSAFLDTVPVMTGYVFLGFWDFFFRRRKLYFTSKFNVDAQWKNAKKELLTQQYCIALSALFSSILIMIFVKG